MGNIILSLDGISKSFPGVKALNEVSFEIEEGTVHALVGENGAGKSTLIKILAGIYQPDAGTVTFDGEKVSFRTPYESQCRGISVVHQEMKLSETLSVAENIFLGNLMYKGIRVDWKGMRKKAKELLNQLGTNLDVNEPVANYSIAQKQMIEICKAINHKCRLLIMDEPSATLTEKEQKTMFEIVRKLRANGVTIIYISHRLEEIFDLADNVTVLRDGQHINTLPVSEVDRHTLISMMVGRELVNEYPKEKFEFGETVLEVKNLNRRGVLKDISFSVRKGEIVGIAGLVGSGRTELARALLGIDKIDSGEVLLYGKPIKHNNFRDAIKNGFGLVPESRKTQGVVQLLSVRRNICMVSMDKLAKLCFISNKLEKKYSNEYVEKLDIATPSVETEVQYLSGGNQQKVVIAKWLMKNSDIIVLDEPTRGIDVGSKSEIYLLINDLIRQGKVVIMISSELPEILGMSDKILVMHEGELKGELTREEATQERILEMCV
ncbi:MAG: sugar ABC transporter ATP-binding protein [Caldicoprobacterales bacterium]|jgi:ABC-type sugar transport system ATPase subunit|nr:sugar ABC transporter ATP-binding protein [Clostridiales bacterium]